MDAALDGLLEQERRLLHDLDLDDQIALADLLRTVVGPFDDGRTAAAEPPGPAH